MARKARTKLRLVIDDRTEHLSDEALYCRRWGHKWETKAMSLNRFNELLRLGHQEDNRYCGNGCGSTWRQLWDVSTGQVLENERSYPKNNEYLLKKGSGRLHRNDARVAEFARRHPELV